MSADNQLEILSYPALDTISARLATSESSVDFFAVVDVEVAKPGTTFAIQRELGPEPVFETPATASTDVDSAIAIYKRLGRMTRTEATDRRLWTQLAFVSFRSYVDERWGTEKTANWQNRVRSRWLLMSATRGDLIRHSVSRLWWAAYLTHDPQHELPLSQVEGDEWAYLRVLFEKADRALQIMDRDIVMYPKVLAVLLEYIRAKGESATETHVRKLMVELILVAGYRELSALGRPYLKEIVDGIGARLDG